MLVYKETDGIGVLQNPQMLDLSNRSRIEFSFPEEFDTLEINKIHIVKLIDGKCSVLISLFEKGTNTLKIVSREKTLPCQPISIFKDNDKLQCTLATSLDVLNVISELQEKINYIENNYVSKEEYNVLLEKINEVVENQNEVQSRLVEIEKNYDPTLI